MNASVAGKPRILVVDDEQVVRESLLDFFREDGYPVAAAGSGREALERIAESPYDILLVDIKMPGMDGLELQQRVKEALPEALLIVMTAYASVETAVRALKEGAYDYVVKPFDPDDLERLVDKASERQALLRENRTLREKIEAISESDMPELVGDSPPILAVKKMVREVGPMETSVLITGESGTGKELVARAIHRASPRRHMPLVVAHCAGLPEGLVESELFGHEKGAFTGAQYRRKGKFELADGGTIFFDEIGDISLKTQIDLLRVLEEKTFTRLGGTEPIRVDFRVVAATNRDLSESVRQDRFRLDLYYRINVFVIPLPPLRERLEDIPLLADFFKEKSAREMGRPPGTISAETVKRMRAYPWPGNVRELQNAIERAMVVRKGDTIHADDLPIGAAADGDASPGDRSLAAAEKIHIQQVLNLHGGNITRAARELQIDRVTLYNKIRRYALTRPGAR